MAKLTLKQIQDLIRSVGFPENKIALMSAICYAESAGRTDAVNPGRGAGGRPTNEYSVGLFQINTLVHKNYSVSQLKDATINAKEALRILNSQGLRAWGGYTDGNYKKYIAEANRVYSGSSGATVINTADIKAIISHSNPTPQAPINKNNEYVIYGVLGLLAVVAVTR